MERARTDRITSLAADQHGLVTTAQLEELAIGRRGFRQLIDDGWLQPLAPRVYGVAAVPASTERHLMLGLLSLGDAAVVSHEAAARLHGFDRSPADAVEFTVPRARRKRAHRFVVHSTGSLAAIDRVRVAGFRCTSATGR